MKSCKHRIVSRPHADWICESQQISDAGNAAMAMHSLLSALQDRCTPGLSRIAELLAKLSQAALRGPSSGHALRCAALVLLLKPRDVQAWETYCSALKQLDLQGTLQRADAVLARLVLEESKGTHTSGTRSPLTDWGEQAWFRSMAAARCDLFCALLVLLACADPFVAFVAEGQSVQLPSRPPLQETEIAVAAALQLWSSPVSDKGGKRMSVDGLEQLGDTCMESKDFEGYSSPSPCVFRVLDIKIPTCRHEVFKTGTDM
jgi:hypothetical protein